MIRDVKEKDEKNAIAIDLKNANAKDAKDKKEKDSIFSVKNISKTLKPMINNIITTVERNKVKIKNRRMNGSFCSPNSSSILKERYINELVNEFEESRSKSRGSSRISSKRNSFNNKENMFPSNSNVFDKLSKSQNIIENQVKPKRTLKEMFSKAFNFTQSSTNKGGKDVSQSRLAKMLQDSNEEETRKPPVENVNVPKPIETTSKVQSGPSTVITEKNKNDIIVDLMNKIDKENLGNNEISIKNSKLNKNSFIDLNDELDESSIIQENNKSKISIKEENKQKMKEIKFNVVIDDTGDDYEFKAFYIKNENVNNNQNEDKAAKEKEKLNKSKDSSGKKLKNFLIFLLNFSYFFIKFLVSKKLNQSKDSRNSGKSNKSKTFVNIFKQGMKNDLVKFEIKVDLDKTLEYNFLPFFHKKEEQENESSNEKNLQNPGLLHKNYTDSISKLLINANDNTLENEIYGNKKLNFF